MVQRNGVRCKEPKKKNAKGTKAHLEAMVWRTKPKANKWLHLTPRISAFGMDAFERGSTMITKIYVYIVIELILAENEGEKSAELVDKMCQITLEVFWTQNVRGEECFERTDIMLKGLGAGWTASFLTNVYPGTFCFDSLLIPPDADGDQSIAEHLGSAVLVTLLTRTVIGLLLSLSDRRFRYPSGLGR